MLPTFSLVAKRVIASKFRKKKKKPYFDHERSTCSSNNEEQYTSKPNRKAHKLWEKHPIAHKDSQIHDQN